MIKDKKRLLILTVAIIIICIVGTILYFRVCEETNFMTIYNSTTKQRGDYKYIVKNGDTILHGPFKRYNEDNIVVAQGNYVNGEPVGKIEYFFDTGEIESIFYRENNKILQESFEFYINGNIRKYILYDPRGLSAFIVKYDVEGNMTSCQGYPVLEIYQYMFTHKDKFNIKKDQYLKVGDTLKHNYLIANIPNATYTFTLESNGLREPHVRRTKKKASTVQTNFEERLTKTGINTFKAIVQYKFKDKKNTILNDTISFDVEAH